MTLAAARTRAVEMELLAGGRLDGWAVEGASDRNRLRAYALVGARAAAPLERRFGGLLHRIEPALEVRALSKSLQAGGAPLAISPTPAACSSRRDPTPRSRGSPPIPRTASPAFPLPAVRTTRSTSPRR